MNTKTFFFISFLLALNGLFAQGTANFSYTVTNNHVTITELATCNCQYYWVSYNYGDTISGALNTSYYRPYQFGHYYRNPGTYTICAYLHNSGIGGCTCSDTFCQTVTITTQGTDCHAEYCYNMYFDTNTNANWVQYNNISTADDSISASLWDIEGALAVSWDMGRYYNILDVPYPAFLFIGTQSGCESAFVVDTVFLGNTCNTLTNYPSVVNSKQNIYAYPNPTQDRFFVGGNHLGNEATVLLVNSMGQEIYNQTWENTQVETAISMAAFPQGVYYLQVITENKVFTQKLIKE